MKFLSKIKERALYACLTVFYMYFNCLDHFYWSAPDNIMLSTANCDYVCNSGGRLIKERAEQDNGNGLFGINSS